MEAGRIARQDGQEGTGREGEKERKKEKPVVPSLASWRAGEELYLYMLTNTARSA